MNIENPTPASGSMPAPTLPERPQRPPRTGCRKIAILLLVLLFLNLVVGIALLTRARSSASGNMAEDEFPSYEEIWSYGDGDVKAVRLELTGVITRDADGGFWDVNLDPVEEWLRQIRAAKQDDAVRAIILEVDSPGGALTPTDEIYQALQEFRASDEGRRVVVHVRDMAASGGYYIAMASDWIVAEPTAVVGSIGVIMQTLNWKELSDKIGIHDVTITAGDNKDLLNPFRPVQPEHLAVFQDILDEMHNRFVNLVQDRLQLDPAALKSLADGRVFSANQAISDGMINQIGYFDDTLAKTRELLGVEALRVVRYDQPRGLAQFLARLSYQMPGINLLKVLRQPQMRIMSLWTP